MLPIIFHIDMNSYFATVSQQLNLEWRNKPLGVCEHLGGIIIAASIEAKKWGIKTGTPVWEAKKIYPKIILTKTNPPAYRHFIAAVIKVASDYTDKVEQASIDELYIDVTKQCNIRGVRAKGLGESEFYKINPYEEAVKIAQEIKRRIKKEVGDYLVCSIGVAPNKLLAKIGSDLKKPDGLVIIRNINDPIPILNPKSEILNFTKDDLYKKLALTDIPGIARKQEKNLNRLGIKTLWDLKNFPLDILAREFGIHGYHLHKMGQLEGSWKPKVEEEVGLKSIGHMYTLPKEYREEKFFEPVLYKLCEMVAKRLRKQGLMGNILHFYVRANRPYFKSPTLASKKYFPNQAASVDGEFSKGDGASKNLGFYVYDGREIFLQCMEVFKTLKITPGDFRLIGVTIAGLRPQNNQLSMFGHEEKLKRITKALDKVNLKYGDFTLCRVPLLSARKVFHDTVGFGRIKEK